MKDKKQVTATKCVFKDPYYIKNGDITMKNPPLPPKKTPKKK